MLCFRCACKYRIYEQYALPPERVVELLAAALDAMVLDAIRRGRPAPQPEPARASAEVDGGKDADSYKLNPGGFRA